MTLDDLEIWVYDCEVFAKDWLFVFKNLSRGQYKSFWNDPKGLKQFVEDHEDAVFAGFNSKRYDQYILKAILAGCSPEEVKEVNDFIIGTDNQPWEHPYLQGFFYNFHNTDLMDDTQMGVSLKSIEGHLGMSIEESKVDFMIETKLTKEQREEVEHYCRHDVDATEALLKIRESYLATKLHLASLADIDPYQALSMTDPKLAAKLFQAKRLSDPDSDARNYTFPDRLDYDMIPKEVIEFFEQVNDPSIPDEELFKMKLEIEIGGCPVTFAFGGLHGALPCYKEVVDEKRLILNYDVASL